LSLKKVKPSIKTEDFRFQASELIDIYKESKDFKPHN